MDIVVFPAEELKVVLGGLRYVAEADGAIDAEEQALVESVARLHDCELAYADIPLATPDFVAARVADPHRRKRAVQLAMVAAIAAGSADLQRTRALEELAAALEVSERSLAAMRNLAEGHMLFARFDVVRRIRDFLKNHDKGGPLTQILRFVGLGEDKELAARYRALGDYPAGTLGRAFYQHLADHGFNFPGERGGLNEDIVFHDVGHVLSGYGVDPQGEIQQAAFQAGFVREDVFCSCCSASSSFIWACA